MSNSSYIQIPKSICFCSIIFTQFPLCPFFFPSLFIIIFLQKSSRRSFDLYLINMTMFSALKYILNSQIVPTVVCKLIQSKPNNVHDLRIRFRLGLPWNPWLQQPCTHTHYTHNLFPSPITKPHYSLNSHPHILTVLSQIL